ncbi:hypothetical protein [Mycobacteroides abscessus]|uniref:hypothetical protein n=1 Tax=Mycobacteroides abscessus TaxID=36809 RepID=UPI002105682D|nr:hypothetical protein [Mycobacteroides abscessus]
MIDVDVRAQGLELTAWAAFETMPTIWKRVRTLLQTGRRVTLVQYLRAPAAAPDVVVVPSLVVDRDSAFGQPRLVQASDRRSRGFTVRFAPGCAQISVFGAMELESTVAQRFHNKQPATMVRVRGFGDGLDDFVEITTWNPYGVAQVTRLQLENLVAARTGDAENVVLRRVDAEAAADAIADWINDCPCGDPAAARSLLNRLAEAPAAQVCAS